MKNDIRDIFPLRLKEAMAGRHLTQVTLAESAGLTQSGISNYLRGVRLPGAEEIRQLAQALNVTTDHLLGWDEIRVQMRKELSEAEAFADQMGGSEEERTERFNAVVVATGELRRAQEKLAELQVVVESLAKVQTLLQGIIQVQRPVATLGPVRYSEPPPKPPPLSSAPGTDTAAHARLVGARPESRRPASRGPGGTTGGPSANVPAPAVPPLPQAPR